MYRNTEDHPIDEALMAWADGDASPVVQEHVDHCTQCRRAALAYRRDDSLLRVRLYRLQCPDPLILGEYALDMLPPAERTAVAAHTVTCVHCAAELALYRADLRHDMATAPDLAGRRREWLALPRVIATLLAGSPAGGQPIPSGLRGDSALLSTSTYLSGDAQITIDIQPDGPDQWMVLGLVLHAGDGGTRHAHAAAEPAGDDGATPLIIEVRHGAVGDQEGSTVLQVQSDEMDNFVCAPLNAGIYEIDVQLADRIVTLPSIVVGVDSP